MREFTQRTARLRRIARLSAWMMFAGGLAGPATVLPLDAAPARESAPALVVFRYDDYSEQSPVAIDRHVIETFRRHGGALTFGVIPNVCVGDVHDPRPQKYSLLGPEKSRILVEAHRAGVVEIAQHGMTHQTHRARPLSEFGGLPLERQIERLKAGREILEQATGVHVETYIPPWDHYDQNTLTALERAGYRVISPRIEAPATRDSRLQYLPATTDIGQVRRVLDFAQRHPQHDRTILVVLFHPYDFKEVDPKGVITIPDFDALIAELSARPNVRLTTAKAVAEEVADLGGNRFLSNQRTHRLASLLPPALRPATIGMYLINESAVQLGIQTAAFYLLVIALIAAAAVLGSRLLLRDRFRAAQWLRSIGAVLLIGAIGYLFRASATDYRKAMLLAGALGTLLAGARTRFRPAGPRID